MGNNAKPPQQSLQKAREEIALKGSVGGHPYHDKLSNLSVSEVHYAAPGIPCFDGL